MRELIRAGALVLLFGIFGAAARAAAPEPRTEDRPVLGDRYPERRTAFPGGVSGLADVVYATYDGYRPLTLDLYVPRGPAPAGGRPLIVYVHGGGWTGGHSRQSGTFANWPGVLASIAARGYVVASLNYRLSREATFPAAIQDVKAALRFLRAHSADYGIDRQRAGIWGGSAGGHLAALAAVTCGVTSLAPPVPVDAPAPSSGDECVQAAATWYGIFDFATMARAAGEQAGPAGAPAARFVGCELARCPPETIRAVSPISYVASSTVPFLMIHGEQDRVVPVAQSQAFAAAIRDAGAVGELVVIPSVDHSFVGATGDVTHRASVDALRRTREFFDRVIGPPRR